MIELKVSDYCHNCPAFSPDCKTLYYSNMRTAEITHYITCSNADECDVIRKHLEKYMGEAEKGE